MASAEPQDFEKKDRRSNDPKSSVKGHAKKEGAGGKFTFGKAGDESGPSVLDKGDPNYDSEAEETKPRKKTSTANRTFESMGQHLFTGEVESSTDTYVWVILQGEDSPRIVGTYSTYEKARAKVENIIEQEKTGDVAVDWKEEKKDRWTCSCDFVRIAKYPVDPVI